MLRRNEICKKLEANKSFYQTLTQTGAFIVLGTSMDFLPGTTQQKSSMNCKLITSIDYGMHFLNLSLVPHSRSIPATYNALDVFSSMSQLDEIYGIIIPIDFEWLNLNRGEYMSQLAVDLSILFKNKVQLLRHCAFVFNNVPQNVDLNELLLCKKQEAEETLAELQAQDLPLNARENFEHNKDVMYQYFLHYIFQSCHESLFIADARNQVFVDHLARLPSVEHNDLALKEFCQFKFVKADFKIVNQVQQTIACWCSPAQMSFATELDKLRQKISDLELSLAKLESKQDSNQTYKPTVFQ